MYAVYKTADGSLYSTGTTLAAAETLAANGLAYVEFDEVLQQTHDWNPQTLAFDIAKTPPPKYVEPDEFLALFTASEWAAANASADENVKMLLGRLALRRQPLDLRSPTIVNGVNYLETVNVIGEGRAAEVLA